jgi:endonuclease YncB( thermonuclease family)
MRHFGSSLLFLLAAGSAFAGDSFSARVVRVVDGDTLVIEAPGHVEKIRLFGIDCPESRQSGGEHATWFTDNLVRSRTVTVIEHDTDRYGRSVAEITLPDGRDLSRELVKYGQAWWYAKYDPDDSEMQNLEASARDRRVGLWEDSNPLPPWEWRKAARGSRSASARSRSRAGD